MPLAALADLKTYLGLPVGTVTADAELSRLLDMASSVVEQYVNRTLSTGARLERRSGYGSDIMQLRDAPITAITSLTIDTVAAVLSNGTTPGYMFSADTVYLLGGLMFNRGRKNIVISYTAGYSTIPADIAHSVIEIAAQAYREKDWIGYQSKSLAGESVSFSRGFLPDSAKIALDPYRRVYACD